MANFGPKDIKKLRETTSAGMMDCKNALKESDGDFDAAVAWLKEKGLGAAAKKSGKVAAEGVVSIEVSDNKAVVVEINSQTDFVAQNDIFKGVVSEITKHAFDNSLADADAINSSEIDGQPFADYLSLKIATIGENLVVRRAGMVSSDDDTVAINGYLHANSRVAVLLGAKCEDATIVEKVRGELKNIAMHAAAMSPTTLSYSDFDADFVESETKGRIEVVKKDNEERVRLGKALKNVPTFVSRLQLTDEVIAEAKTAIEAELKAEGKPEKIWDRIVPGKLDRFISDNTLLDQELALLDQKYVMDDSVTVGEHIAKISGGKALITDFIRLEVGEGIEVVEEDFAAEVAKQMA
ncbi:elongation factor Ts [Sulfurovum sp. bin170]|uniref:translation elongation factor Ts n=1 Tax=Sulfurovum sp. bin170 TaxID=2695268 RepID=UPI0013DF8179|nr:translation elongation factor Ts [Sulfurovum sp. bin170]NEW60741.1 elongation factor Ts [Sulfurovum sp. bin170]